jgi:hypothetical protein
LHTCCHGVPIVFPVDAPSNGGAADLPRLLVVRGRPCLPKL